MGGWGGMLKRLMKALGARVPGASVSLSTKKLMTGVCRELGVALRVHKVSLGCHAWGLHVLAKEEPIGNSAQLN